MTDAIKSLHSAWNKATGQTVNLRATERIWYELANLDFTADDVLCVGKHVMNFNKTHATCNMNVQVLRICGDVENFASICAEAKAKQRNAVKPTTDKEKALTAWRGCEAVSNGNAHKISEFLRIPQP